MMPLVPLLSLFFLGVQAVSGSDWTYEEGELDEEHWSTKYPACGGQEQSPIDIQRKDVHYNPQLNPLLLSYETQKTEFTVTNNGHTVKISVDNNMYFIAPDGTKYRAEQIHFHWGGASSKVSGSEHTVDGIRFVAEVHAVHFNDKYQSYEEAQNATDGLAVIAFFLKINEYLENSYYSYFIDNLGEVKYADQSTVMNGLHIREMFPKDTQHYYHYHGSLTTPPCTENVNWFVLRDTVDISKAQAYHLENTVLDSNNKTLQNDYRHPQPRNNRVVEANFAYVPDPDSASLILLELNNNIKTLLKTEKQKKQRHKKSKSGERKYS